MKITKQNTSARRNKTNKEIGKRFKKKREKAKKLKKNKLKKVKAKTTANSGITKKSTFNYSLKKYQNLPLRDKMLEKLKSSRFRYINEQLYTMNGRDALKFFQNDSEAFQAYHEGYTKQMKSWPKNPVDLIIDSLKKMIAANKELVIGDFGCGNAKIAKSFPEIKVHSFDLASLDPCVTVCDMAHTPLKDETLDVAVFCLSLMGTNFSEYLVEANRVLKIGIVECGGSSESIRKRSKIYGNPHEIRFQNNLEKFVLPLILHDDLSKGEKPRKKLEEKSPQPDIETVPLQEEVDEVVK